MLVACFLERVDLTQMQPIPSVMMLSFASSYLHDQVESEKCYSKCILEGC